MSHWDVIVMGAGQAGCAAAWDLAAGGARVLLIHGAAGREKPCAGGVTIKAAQRYRFPISGVVRESITAMVLSQGGEGRQLRLDHNFCLMTHRRELDALCREQARQRGAHWLTSSGVRALRQDAHGVTLSLRDGSHHQGDYLIAADGAHSPIRRLLQGQDEAVGAVALEAHLPRRHACRYPAMTLDFQAVKQGYGWLFPKGDHINLGLYVWRRDRARPTVAALRRYALKTLGSDLIEEVGGYPLGTWLAQRAPACERVLFVGDAAGATEPLLGEGIYGALVSGQLAAAALLAGRPQDYPSLLGEWRDEVRQMGRLTRLFYGIRPFGVAALSHWLGPTLLHGYAQGWTLGQTKRAWRGAAL